MSLRLYGYWRSSSAWRVRIALHHKGLSFERVPVHLVRDGGEQHLPAHLGRNPMAQVPVLEVDGRFLGQSMAILEYLEERFPEPSLLPGDALERARARQLAQDIISGVQPLQNLSVLQRIGGLAGQADDARAVWARHWIESGLRALEVQAQQHAGGYLASDALSLADCALVPQLYNARRFDCDLAAFPALLAIDGRCAAMPAFVAAHPDAQSDAICQDSN